MKIIDDEHYLYSLKIVGRCVDDLDSMKRDLMGMGLKEEDALSATKPLIAFMEGVLDDVAEYRRDRDEKRKYEIIEYKACDNWHSDALKLWIITHELGRELAGLNENKKEKEKQDGRDEG